jgi:signal transduction histidine kinase
MVDRWFAAAVLVIACAEVALRGDLPSRPAALLFAAIIATAIVIRRRRPLTAVLLAFGSAVVVTLLEHLLHAPKIAPWVSVTVLALPYSLARRGSKREVLIGAVLLALTWLASLMNHEMPQLSDAIGGAVVLLFSGALGVAFRFRAEAQVRAIAQARLLEREQLARELHDSVAHHMMAITLQAQATRAVLTTRPEDAKTALAAIEDESKRALSELRALVGSLRDEGGAELAPAGGIADLPALAARTTRPTVEVALSGDLEGLPPAVERAVFRVAQESITNAVRHARNATKIEVHIAAGRPSVRLSVRDDGETAGASRGAGFGLVGMAERAALLGGTFEAGPLAQGGWEVAAVFPRDGRRP